MTVMSVALFLTAVLVWLLPVFGFTGPRQKQLQAEPLSPER